MCTKIYVTEIRKLVLSSHLKLVPSALSLPILMSQTANQY